MRPPLLQHCCCFFKSKGLKQLSYEITDVLGWDPVTSLNQLTLKRFPQMQSQNIIPDNNTQEQKKTVSFRRVTSSKSYTATSNELIRDKSTPPKARMLLIWLLSFPTEVLNKKTGQMEPWVVYHSYIIREFPTSETALNRMIEQLIKAGYMKRERKRGSKGVFQPYEYIFADFKLFQPNAENQAGESRPGFTSLVKEVLLNTDLTSTSPKETTTIQEEPDHPPRQKPVLAAVASSDKEGNTESKKVVAQPSPPTINRPKDMITWQDKLDQCPALKNLDIPVHEKEWVLNRYSLPAIEISISWVTNPTTHIKKSVIQALKWHLANPPQNRPKAPLEQESSIEKNKKRAQHLEMTMVAEYYKIQALNKQVFIEPKAGMGKLVEILYDNENFDLKIEDAIRMGGFKSRV